MSASVSRSSINPYAAPESVAERDAVERGLAALLVALAAPPFSDGQTARFAIQLADRGNPYCDDEQNYTALDVAHIRQPMSDAWDAFKRASGARYEFLANSRLRVLVPHRYLYREYAERALPFTFAHVFVVTLLLLLAAYLVGE